MTLPSVVTLFGGRQNKIFSLNVLEQKIESYYSSLGTNL